MREIAAFTFTTLGRPTHVKRGGQDISLPTRSNFFVVATASSTSSISETAAATATGAPPSITQAGTTFEPVIPDTTALVGFGALVVLCVIAALVWNNSVVPISRTKLAISKSRGEVREYLDELSVDNAKKREAEVQSKASAETIAGEEGHLAVTALESSESATDDARSFERWLFADWLSSNKSKKAPAIPILKDAKWNSGDNPVVVTSALMVVGILVASITERVAR